MVELVLILVLSISVISEPYQGWEGLGSWRGIETSGLVGDRDQDRDQVIPF